METTPDIALSLLEGIKLATCKHCGKLYTVNRGNGLLHNHRGCPVDWPEYMLYRTPEGKECYLRIDDLAQIAAESY